MRIVCWNMNHWRRTPAERKSAWQFLTQLKPDVALLQEAVPGDDTGTANVVFRSQGIGSSRPWGSAVVSFGKPAVAVAEVRSRYSKRPANLHQTLAGSLAIAQVGDLTLISHYGAIENGYAVTTVHRQLSDLTPLFDSSLGRRVVLGGDLNITSQFEEPDRRRHQNVLDRLASLGMVDCLALDRPPRPKLEGCPCTDSPCRHVRTLRHDKSDTPWQKDYIFVSETLAGVVKSCFALDSGDPDPWQFSDHCPVILELSIEMAEPGAAPNGGPATQLGNSGATEGPPSVS